MRKVFNMPRFLSSVAAAVLWCIFAAKPVMAQICYLPTGICEESSKPKVSVLTCDTSQCPNCNAKKCDVEGYYPYHLGNGWNCSYDGCCNVWRCYVIDCNKLGFSEGPTSSKTTWPSGKKASEGWECDWCLQGYDYFWSCKRKDCTSGVSYDSCDDETEDFVPNSEYGYSGGYRCGECVPKSCPSDTISEEEIQNQGGCFKASEVKKIKEKKCYKLQYFDYITQEERDANYTVGSKSCYNFYEFRSDNGKMCYKPSPITCPDNQYINKRIEAGKEVCECHRYDYNFEASETTIRLKAASPNDPQKPDFKNITVISTRSSDAGMDTGLQTEDWDYEFPTNIDGISIEKSGNNLIINEKGLRNTSQTTDIVKTFDMVQTEANGATTRTITITVIIEHDTCPTGMQFSENCEPPAGWKSKLEGASVTGASCYKCYNDNCPVCPIAKPAYQNYCPTFSKTKCCGAGNYYEEKTDYGSTCYGQMSDTCPANYPNKGGDPQNDQCREFTSTDFGSNCYKNIPDDCSATNGGKASIKSETYPSDGRTYQPGNNTECGHKCWIDDTCPNGYDIKKGVGESCPSDGNYESTTTTYGSTCCKAKDDDCAKANGNNSKYKNCGKETATTVGGKTYVYGNKTAFGSNCRIDDTCPATHPMRRDMGKGCPANGNGYSYVGVTNDYGRTCCKETLDDCPAGYPDATCKSGECKSETSVNGRTCFIDDKCPDGYSKTKPSGDYKTDETAAGTTCYISDNCPNSKARKSCEQGHTCQSSTATPAGTPCYIDDTCPNYYTKVTGSCPAAGTGCVNDVKSTDAGSSCCRKVCDECTNPYPYESCTFSECASTKTPNGKTCYGDDRCPTNVYPKASKTKPSHGVYIESASTPVGTPCYVDDKCPNDYPLRECPGDQSCKSKKNATDSKRTCYALNDVCPNDTYVKGSRPVFIMEGYTYDGGYTYKASGYTLKADKSGYTAGTVEYGANGITTVQTPAGNTCYKCGIGNKDHGYFGDCCKTSDDCKFSTHGPLYCVHNTYQNGGDSGYGICVECDYANNPQHGENDHDCRWTTKTITGLWNQTYGGYCELNEVCTEYQTFACDDQFHYANEDMITHYKSYTEATCDSDVSNNYGKFCCKMAVSARNSSYKGRAQVLFDARFPNDTGTTTYPVVSYYGEGGAIRNHYKAEPKYMTRSQIGSLYMQHKNARCASNGECTSQ